MNKAQAIDRMRQVIHLQHKALAAEDSYVLRLRRYIKALRQMPPRLPSASVRRPLGEKSAKSPAVAAVFQLD